MQSQAVTLFAAGSAFVGILVGHGLTRSWQHQQWIRDRRLQEYQEVLRALTSAYMAMARLHGKRFTPNHNQDSYDETMTITVESFRVLRDRIFIAKELGFEKVISEWELAANEFQASDNIGVFGRRFTALHDKLVRMALAPLQSDGIPRMTRWRAMVGFRKTHDKVDEIYRSKGNSEL